MTYIADREKAGKLADKVQFVINNLRGAVSGHLYELLRATLSAAHDLLKNASYGYIIKSYAAEKLSLAKAYLEMIDDE